MPLILYHSTPWWNLESIHELGLSLDFARGSPPRIWLHALTRLEWAVIHCSARHHCNPDDIRTFAVSVPRSWIKTKAAGLFIVGRTIPPARIGPDLTRQLRQGVIS